MIHRITVPKASAKRLEKDRRLIIQGNTIFGREEVRHTIPEGATTFEFDFEDESINEPDILDGEIYYNFFVEYRNSTGTRVERIEVELNAT